MTPIEQAKAVYEQEECGRAFHEDLNNHLGSGYVYNSPSSFVMGRFVKRPSVIEDGAAYRDVENLIVDSAFQFHRPICNCFHVWLAAGDLAEIAEVLKSWTSEEYVCFERKNRLRFYWFESILNRFYSWTNSTVPPSPPILLAPMVD